MRLLSAEKKKKDKHCNTKTTTETTTDSDDCLSSSSTTSKHKKNHKTTAELAENDADSCTSPPTTKTKKATKKSKTRSTKSSQQKEGDDTKSSDDMINNGSVNKWKKIQNFFFKPPNWSYSKTYKAYGPTTSQTKRKDESRTMQLNLKEGTNDQTTIRDYLHMIPNMTYDQNKDKQSVREEIITKNTNHGETIKSTQYNTPNIPFKPQQNYLEKIPSQKFEEVEMVSKAPINQDGKFSSRNQEEGHDKISSMGITEERTTSIELCQQGATFFRPWFLKQEEITPGRELSESDKMTSKEGVELASRVQSSVPEKEETSTQEIYQTDRVFYNYANTPSNNPIIEPKEDINYYSKETYTHFFPTANTIDINEPIDERQLQLKREGITDNIKEKYEVSMFREDHELPFEPESTIESEIRPSNETDMKNSDFSHNQNNEIKGDKWKHIFNFNEPDYEQLKNLYSNIINRHVTESDLITSGIENTFDKIIKSNFGKMYNAQHGNNMTDTSNIFLKAFGNFFKKDIPEIFPNQDSERQYKTSLQPEYDSEAYNQKVKQHFFVNTETKLPEIIKNSSKDHANEEKYATVNLDTTFKLVNFTIDNLQKIEPKFATKDEPLLKKFNEINSTVPSSTALKQYSIDTWPKHTDKSDSTTDNNILNISTPSYPTPQLDVSTSSNWQKELNITRAADISSTETSSESNEFTEFPNQIGTFESLITIPLVITNKDADKNDFSSATGVTTTKHLEHQSLLNLTLHPMLFDNLWGIQSYLNYSSFQPVSTPTIFPDDKIAFDNQHEFNSDHHVQSTLQPYFRNTISSEWVPFNIPDLGNEFNIINPTTMQMSEENQENIEQFKDFRNINGIMNEILKKNEMEMNKKRNFTSFSKYLSLPNEISERNLFITNQPPKKPEGVEKIHKYISHHKESVNDPIWNEIMFQTKLRKDKLGSSVKKLNKSEKPPVGNQIFQKFRKPSFINDKIIDDDNLINFIPFPRVTNYRKNDVHEFFLEPFFKNFKQMELEAQNMDSRNFDKLDVIKSRIVEITTQVMNTDSNIRNKLNFCGNLNGQLSSEAEQHKELTQKYGLVKAELGGELSQNANPSALLEYQRKNASKVDEKKVDPLSIYNNDMLIKQLSTSSLNENRPITITSGRYIHNEQNEKLLANEKSFDRQLSLSSPAPVNIQKEIKFDQLKNNIDLLKSITNQSSLENTSNDDKNKNEISAIQMSAIKIIKKKPDMLMPSLDDPFNYISGQKNNSNINHEMSQMFMKMQDFVNKLGMKKVLLKRGVAYPHDLIKSNSSWENKVSPSLINSDEQYNNAMLYPKTNDRQFKISDKWRYNMQSVIDKLNEKRSSHLNINDTRVQNNIDKLVYYTSNNYEKENDQFLNNNTLKKNAGNKKMKSRELEFILDRNLPRLPLNKRRFITYMMTGSKNAGSPITSDEDKRSQLSKANLQNLIDRNVKKDKVVDLTNKRPRKKQWNTHSFP